MGSSDGPPPPPSPPVADRPDHGLATLVAGIVAVLSLLAAFFLSRNPVPFLFVSLATGITALVLGLLGRRGESMATTGMVLGQGAIAGTLLFVIVWVSAALVAVALFLLIFFLFFWQAPTYTQSGSCSCPAPSCDCSSGCPVGSACTCGGCGNCGGGCGGCGGGGCGCVALTGIVAGGAGRLAPLLRGGDRFAHHPDSPEYARDVFVVRGVRYCVGCFTTFPLLLAATAALALAPLPLSYAPLLATGAAGASAQVMSSVGRARSRWTKAAVKTSLGIGLALVVAGVRAAPWAPQTKALVLAFTLALALSSAIPRARRMRREASRRMQPAACSCAAGARPEGS